MHDSPLLPDSGGFNTQFIRSFRCMVGNGFFVLCVIALLLREVKTDEVCANTTISALSIQDALYTAVHCTYSVRTLDYSDQSDVDRSVAACVNQISGLNPSEAPIATSQCRLCYQVLVTDMLTLMAGRMVSGTFVPTTSSLAGSCNSLSTLEGREECFKHDDVSPVLLDFQKCAGYAIIYPAGTDLATRRHLGRENVSLNTLRLAFGSISSLPASLAAITDQYNRPPSTPSVLNLHLCYLTFMEDISRMIDRLPQFIVADCVSAEPTDTCFSYSSIEAAKTRFSKCTGFEIDSVPNACSNATDVANVLQNYDVLGNVIPYLKANYSSTNLAQFFANMTDNVTEYTSTDCAECFRELAQDIQSNILENQATMPSSLFETFLTMCKDSNPHACHAMVGIQAMNNFQQCSGYPFNMSEIVTTTTTPAPIVQDNSTDEVGTRDPVSGSLVSFSPSSMFVSLAALAALAL